MIKRNHEAEQVQDAAAEWPSTIPHSIASDAIGLPTKGATVNSAEMVTKAAESENGTYAYYRVKGAIHSVDKSAPDIEFQVNLPQQWNHKLVQFGGGGFDGWLITAEGPAKGQGKEDIPPLAQGYVTFGSDGGHKAYGWDSEFALDGDVLNNFGEFFKNGTPDQLKKLKDIAMHLWDSEWALNDEALNNFASDQLKKTKDVAMVLAKAYYKKAPTKVYFIGGSNGGREGLMAAQRYPEDYDGVVSLFPVLNWVPKTLKDHDNTEAVLANQGAGWIGRADYEKIKAAVLEECGAMDGKVDGIITGSAEADAAVDRINARLKDELTPAQLAAWSTFLADKQFLTPLANNHTVEPGYSLSQLLIDWICNHFGSAPMKRDGTMTEFSDSVIQYQIVRQESFNPADFKFSQWKEATEQASKLLDATDPDITAFEQRGGKLIVLHGTADQMVAVRGTTDYYNKLEEVFGKKKLDSFAKLYLVPGYGHGNGGSFILGRDLLQDLDQWVEKGQAPGELEVTDQNEAAYGHTQILKAYQGK